MRAGVELTQLSDGGGPLTLVLIRLRLDNEFTDAIRRGRSRLAAEELRFRGRQPGQRERDEQQRDVLLHGDLPPHKQYKAAEYEGALIPSTLQVCLNDSFIGKVIQTTGLASAEPLQIHRNPSKGLQASVIFMQIAQLLLFAFGLAALVRGWLSLRGTALFHAVHWGGAAWLAWGAAIFLQSFIGPAGNGHSHPNPITFVALCLTGCAGVAVLGARRPICVAWNFVVLALFAVMVLPLVETALIGTRSLEWLRITFLAATLGVSTLNYLPTRFGPAVFLAGLACAAEMVALLSPEPLSHGAETDAVRLCLLAAPSLAYVLWSLRSETNDLDQTWRDFRDRWGVVWGQRVREQFNHAAAHAGWPVKLNWSGLTCTRPVDEPTRAAMREALAALLKRFVTTR